MTTYGTAQAIAEKDYRRAKQKKEVTKLKDDQRTGHVQMIKANRSSKHKVREAEKGFVHVELITKETGPDGKELKKSHIHQCTPQEFEQAIENNSFAIYSGVEIIHDPTYIPPKRSPKKKTTKQSNK